MAASPSPLLFDPGSYPDEASLRRAFCAAYAEHLRNPGRQFLVGNSSPERRDLLNKIQAERDRDVRRGQRSFMAEVKLRASTGCALKRHCTGCMRQVIGYAEKLAQNDPERFIWVKDWSKAAKRGGKGENGNYSDSQIKRAVWAFEGSGILAPAQRARNGVLRAGWIVAKHDDVAATVGGRCHLQVTPKFTISPRAHGQRLDCYLVENRGTLKRDPNDGDIENRGTVRGTLESMPGDCPGDSGMVAGGLWNGCNPLEGKGLQDGLEKTVCPNPVNPVKREPSQPLEQMQEVKETEVVEEEVELDSVTGNERELDLSFWQERPSGYQQESKADVSFNDHDQNSRSTPLEPKDFPLPETVVSNLDEIVASISRGKFDTAFLDKYKHKDELLECCQKAVEWVRHSYDRKPADAMAKAMELMRDTYDLNVPGGWVPVLRELRAKERRPARKPKTEDSAFCGSATDFIAQIPVRDVREVSFDL